MGAAARPAIALGELFKAASKTEKASIESMSGLGRATMYKAIGTGNLSAKLAVAIAQTLNVNPFFLTGESGDRGACSDKIIRDFLIGKDKAYEKLFAGTKPGRKPRAAKPAAATPTSVSEPPQQPVAEDPAGMPEFVNQFIDGMTEEQMITLMRSILLRAGSGVPNYVELAFNLKKLLATEGLY